MKMLQTTTRKALQMSNQESNKPTPKDGVVKRVFKAGVGYHLASNTRKSLTGIASNLTDLFRVFKRCSDRVDAKKQRLSAYEFWRRYKNVQYSAYASILVSAYCATGFFTSSAQTERLVMFGMITCISLALAITYSRLLYQTRLRLRENKAVVVSWPGYLRAVVKSPKNLLPLSLPKNKNKWGVK
jgi:hypothetical protein